MWDQLNTRGKIGAAVVVALAVGAIGFWSGQGRPSQAPIEVTSVPSGPSGRVPNAGLKMVVEVAGAVARPGVYELPGDARVLDAIKAAGGPVSGADTSGLNLAQRVNDGLKIHVPLVGEAPLPSVGSAGAGGVVSINSASKDELESLPGVGPAMSKAIIEYRIQHGGFRSVEELMEIPGIGPKTFEELKDQVTL